MIARTPLRSQPSAIQSIRAKHSWHDALRVVRRVFGRAGDLYDGQADRGAAGASGHHAHSALRQRDSFRRTDLGDDSLLRRVCGRCKERLSQAVSATNDGISLHPRQGAGLRDIQLLDAHDRHPRGAHPRVIVRAADGNVRRNGG